MGIAILTGANGQIGRSFLQILRSENYFVYAVDLKIDNIKEIDNVRAVILDITEEKQVIDFYRKIDKVDVVINNAGIGVFSPFEERTAEEFIKVMKVNLLGTFLMSREAVKIMKKQKKGKIINIGSIYGQISSDPRIYGKSNRNNSEVYSATKAGIIMLTKYMAVHFAPYNIQTNCISPGGIFDNQSEDFVQNYIKKVPAGKMAEVEDLKSALKFLISDASNYVNGQNITIDGGFTLW